MAAKATRSVGRPAAFRRERALDRAMRVFWKKGFEGASLNDLTAAMGIKPPSLYAAFGNKQKLFEESLARYIAGPAAFMTEALGEAAAYEVTARLLRETAEFLTTGRTRCGCMAIQGGMIGGEESGPVRRKLVAVRRRGQEALRQRFERAKSEGDLAGAADAADLARFVSTVLQGMTVQAIDGATREELLRVAEMALQAMRQKGTL